MTILTKQQLMDTFGFGPDLLRTLVARGMPHLKISARVSAYVLEEVVEWIKENGDEPERPAPTRRRVTTRPRSRTDGEIARVRLSTKVV